MSDADPGYDVAVADGLVFSLVAADWDRLAAQDAMIVMATIKRELAALTGLGVKVWFGDGEVPVIPDAGAGHVEVLRDQLRRIREVAPLVLARGADTFARILCTDPWPRIYTTAALDTLPTTPVHVIQASDLAVHPEQWARIGQLARFDEIRWLVMFGSPLDRSPFPLDLTAFRGLRALDLSRSGMREIPRSLARVETVEALDLSHNPLAGALAGLVGLTRLRYLDLRGTAVGVAEAAALRMLLPPGCEIAL